MAMTPLTMIVLAIGALVVLIIILRGAKGAVEAISSFLGIDKSKESIPAPKEETPPEASSTPRKRRS